MKNFVTKKDAVNIFTLSVFLPTAVTLAAASLNAGIWLSLALTQICAIAAAIFYVGYTKTDVRTVNGLNKPPKVLNVLLIAALSLCLILFVNPIENLFTELLVKLGYTPTESVFDFTAMNGWELTLAVIFLCVTPALWEELVFRGLVLEGFRNKKTDLKAIVISAALFMLLHMSVEQMLYPFLAGIVFGFVYCATGSLWNTVLLHFFNNLFVVLFSSVTAAGDFVANNWGLMFPAFIIGAAILFFIWKKMDNSEYLLPSEKTKAQPYSLTMLIVSAGFCITLILYGAFWS